MRTPRTMPIVMPLAALVVSPDLGPGWVLKRQPSTVDYRAGDVERREGSSSRSMTAMGSWETDLPVCPSDTASPTP